MLTNSKNILIQSHIRVTPLCRNINKVYDSLYFIFQSISILKLGKTKDFYTIHNPISKNHFISWVQVLITTAPHNTCHVVTFCESKVMIMRQNRLIPDRLYPNSPLTSISHFLQHYTIDKKMLSDLLYPLTQKADIHTFLTELFF